MATLTVHNLDDDIARRLRVEAAERARSAEAEHGGILRKALAVREDEMARRIEVAARLAEFRDRTANRGSDPVAKLLSNSRADRTVRLMNEADNDHI